MHIAVAGGTGLVGRRVVETAREHGHEVTVLSRARGVDLTTGAGLEAALGGADAVVDVSNGPSPAKAAAARFFAAATGHLLRAEQAAGVGRHVVLSIVGVDRAKLGYYQAKLAQEEQVRAGGVPWTILRATQFHEFAAQLIARGYGPLVPAPKLQSQPIAAREVARELVRLAAGDPAGAVPDLAGPEVLYLPDLVRQVLRARRQRKLVVPVPLPGPANGLLPTAPGPRGTQTFAEWLDTDGTLGV